MEWGGVKGQWRTPGDSIVGSLLKSDMAEFDRVEQLAFEALQLDPERRLTVQRAATVLWVRKHVHGLERLEAQGSQQISLDSLCEVMHLIKLQASDIVFNQGDPGDAYYIVFSGQIGMLTAGRRASLVQVVQHADEHRTPAGGGDGEAPGRTAYTGVTAANCFTVANKGDTFGELALIQEAPRSLTAVALVPTLLVKVSREEYVRFANADAEAERAARIRKMAVMRDAIPYAPEGTDKWSNQRVQRMCYAFTETQASSNSRFY